MALRVARMALRMPRMALRMPRASHNAKRRTSRSAAACPPLHAPSPLSAYLAQNSGDWASGLGARARTEVRA
eukprot:611305-Rhodomonas_salina.1